MPASPRPRRVTVTRYAMPDGTRCRKDTPGAVRHKELSSNYYAWLGGHLVPLGTSDEAVAWETLRRLQREHREAALGISRPHDALATLSLTEHIDAYAQSLRDKGTSKDQVDLVRGRLLHLAELAGWRRAGDITADGLAATLASLGRSAQTRNHYATHCRALCRWLGGRIGHDPLAEAALPRQRVEAAREYVRRCPTPAELGQLFRYLERGPVAATVKWTADDPAIRCGMTARQRAMGYRVMLGTGLRADELRSLDRTSFDLDRATVTVRAAYSKHRRDDVLPLPKWLATALRDWFTVGGNTWQAFPRNHPGRLLQHDLTAANVLIDTDDGAFDMHSFRVHYITELACQPGISPKVLLSLARHCDPKLTLAIYARVKQGDQQAAVDLLPDPARAKRRRGNR